MWYQRKEPKMEYKYLLYSTWMACAMYISYYHGIISVFTSNHPMENQLFVNDIWLDLIIRSIFRLSMPLYWTYKLFRQDPEPEIEMQNLRRD